MLDKWEIPTVAENGGVQILPDIARSVQGYLDTKGVAREQILGLGIGVPGPVSGKGVVNVVVLLLLFVLLLKRRIVSYLN